MHLHHTFYLAFLWFNSPSGAALLPGQNTYAKNWDRSSLPEPSWAGSPEPPTPEPAHPGTPSQNQHFIAPPFRSLRPSWRVSSQVLRGSPLSTPPEAVFSPSRFGQLSPPSQSSLDFNQKPHGPSNPRPRPHAHYSSPPVLNSKYPNGAFIRRGRSSSRNPPLSRRSHFLSRHTRQIHPVSRSCSPNGDLRPRSALPMDQEKDNIPPVHPNQPDPVANRLPWSRRRRRLPMDTPRLHCFEPGIGRPGETRLSPLERQLLGRPLGGPDSPRALNLGLLMQLRQPRCPDPTPTPTVPVPPPCQPMIPPPRTFPFRLSPYAPPYHPVPPPPPPPSQPIIPPPRTLPLHLSPYAPPYHPAPPPLPTHDPLAPDSPASPQ